MLRGDRRAFSLIELLVVIGVLLILIGLALPSLASARDRARQTVNMAKMRNGLALTTQYCTDFRGVFPLNQPRSVIYSAEEWHLAIARWSGDGWSGYQFEIGENHEAAIAMSHTVLADPSHFDPANPQTFIGSPAKPVLDSAVQHPSAKGILWQSYVPRNTTTQGSGSYDLWCCGYERYIAPIGFADGSVAEYAWESMRVALPPNAFENIGFPVASTWNGPRGQDR